MGRDRALRGGSRWRLRKFSRLRYPDAIRLIHWIWLLIHSASALVTLRVAAFITPCQSPECQAQMSSKPKASPRSLSSPFAMVFEPLA